jgi:hypothetical protein
VAKEESRNQQRGVSKDAFGLQGQGRLKLRYVLSDVFYSASQNMSHIKEELKREFIMALKTNRKVALSLEDKRKGAYDERVLGL